MITIDLNFIQLLVLMMGYIIGKVLGEVTILMFREWNYRRSRR